MAKPQSAKCRVPAILVSLFACASFLPAQTSQPLSEPASPGKAMQDAAKASALYRTTTEPERPKTGPIEVLSDTRGVDFGPYLRDLIPSVRGKWYALIPADAATKRGSLAIEFSVQKDGHLGAMKMATSSGDDALDRAAWGAITKSDPFPPLPGEYTGPYLSLRFRFFYNPEKADLVPYGISSKSPAPIVHAVLIGDPIPPEYPKKARKDNVEGLVRLEAHIGPDGKVRSIDSLEGSAVLEEVASKAIRKWRFQPAHRAGDLNPVEDHVLIRVDFHLDGEQVQAQVLGPKPATFAKSPQ